MAPGKALIDDPSPLDGVRPVVGVHANVIPAGPVTDNEALVVEQMVVLAGLTVRGLAAVEKVTCKLPPPLWLISWNSSCDEGPRNPV